MQSCDCCCQYNYRASMTHLGCDSAQAGERASPSLHRSPPSNKNGIIREKQNSTNLFSIDAILSKPIKTEIRKRSVEDGEISPPFRSAKESVSPSSYGLCCSSPKNRFPECRSPHCPSPGQISPHRPECLTFYRRPTFTRPPKEFHFDRRLVHEPTMVPIEKQSYSSACLSCQDCKMVEMRSFRYGNSSVISCNDEAVMQSNHLDHSNDSKRNKRKRTIFTTEQLDRLEHEFQHQQYVVGQERKYLAVELGLNEIQVKVWFQNRRIKWRKQKGSRIQPVAVDMESY